MLLGSIVLSVGLLVAAAAIDDEFWSSLLIAFATGLAGTATFSIAHTLLVTRTSEKLMQDAARVEIQESMNRLQMEFIPSEDFPDSSEPLPRFNEVLTEDWNRSNRVWFRGISGRHTAVRLSENNNRQLELICILPDLSDPSSLVSRAQYFFNAGLTAAETQDDAERELLAQCMTGLVGLMSYSGRCAQLEIVLTPSPSLDRYEIFTDASWVSLFSAGRPGVRYPRTIRVGKENPIHMLQQSETHLLRLQAIKQERYYRIPRAIRDDEDFLRLLSDVSGSDVKPEELAHHRHEFRQHLEKHRAAIARTAS